MQILLTFYQHLCLILCTCFSLLPHPRSSILMQTVNHRDVLHSSQKSSQFVQHLLHFSLGKSGRDIWSMEKRKGGKEQTREDGGNDGTVGVKSDVDGKGRAYRDSRDGGDRGRWRLCGSTDVWTVGGQGRWVVALKWVLTESFLTWRFTQALSKGGGTSASDPFPLVMNIYLVRAFTGCCVEWQMVVNYLYSIPISSFALFHLWLTHLISGSDFTQLFTKRLDRTEMRTETPLSEGPHET